ANAKALSDRLIENGFNIVSGGTDNHLMLVDLRPMNITGKELEHRLDEVRVTCNKNAIPFDPEKPGIASGIRLGTPAVTTRGMVESDMVEIADIIAMVAGDFEANKAEALERVTKLIDKYPIYE
ncbi:MAG: serine hydroxymethyltransferase, partial [Lachnospirales bacterium]